MTSVRVPPPDFANPLTVPSRTIFSFAALDKSLTPRTGQTPTFARDAAVEVRDYLGSTYDVVPHQPAWTHFDRDEDGFYEEPAILLGADDLLRWSFQRKPGAMTGLLDLVLGAGTGTGDRILSIGADDMSGARLFIDVNSEGLFAVNHHNGTSIVAGYGPAAPDVGDRVRFRWELFTDGSVRMHQSINNGAEASGAASESNTLPAAWGDELLWLNSYGNILPAAAAYSRLIVAPGSGRNLATMEAIY